ncbi:MULTISPECIES: ribulokinase [unclassified Leeuwenhoekiella]|uniref:ribulokinase n=1 Tax=unclassified Leeuwenhoekiella TaxID=2615029 RepID=UPI000C3A1145|nr:MULTISPECIES: ribulokinase [unclassified Leeuwenhoekiella]MAW94860.1 ribulokinase [Leeuwenhoekiella sp.]MBA79580.1 ribulokinase [Leeuwenhoekiella sp.]|tara:strand:- start:13473 stop:15170 length:1698 start_codon:yes stop_codon:yes gene_type:complete
MKEYVIGLDYGSDSVRAVLIDAANGQEIEAEVSYYQRWKKGLFCNPSENRFRQHPLDHLEGLENTIKAVVSRSGVEAAAVKGICIDTTGSSPIPVNEAGIPLSLTAGFEENPNAMMVLWKDHTAIDEANEINDLARSWGGEDFTKYEGGIYSSEWFWAKILHVAREDEEVKQAAYSWMEHCDWMTYTLLEGVYLEDFKRSRCAAGHKAMWHESWGGLPPEEFLGKLDPYLAQLRDRLYTETYTSDEIAGTLSAAWAEKLGLTTDTVIAVGTFDAHAGAVGAKVEEHTLVRVMGTSTCDISVSAPEVTANKTVRGICGQVEGSVIPGLVGLEAGQSAFGDLLAWFKDVLSWPVDNLVLTSDILSAEQKEELKAEIDSDFIRKLSDAAEAIPHNEAIPVALDWINGRRTPDANQELEAAITNLNMGTRAPHIFKALVNAICFGSKKIMDRFADEGIEIKTVVGIGGVARKSKFIMQSLANTLNVPIKVAASDQAPALGAAVYAAVAAGIYPDVITASQTLGSDYEAEYQPQPQYLQNFSEQMERYEALSVFVENSIVKSKKTLEHHV